MHLIKSKKRVADHGEVFTHQWLVENMLDLVTGIPRYKIAPAQPVPTIRQSPEKPIRKLSLMG